MMGSAPPVFIVSHTYDSESETKTLASMVAREQLVHFLDESVKACTESRPWQPLQVLRALKAVRSATLEVVANIIKWRESLVQPEVFPWNGNKENYLIKLTRDLDFLRYLPIKEYYGFTLAAKNPFVLAISVKTGSAAAAASGPKLGGRGVGRGRPESNGSSARTGRGVPSRSNMKKLAGTIEPRRTPAEEVPLLHALATVDDEERMRIEAAVQYLREEQERSGTASAHEKASPWALDMWLKRPYRCMDREPRPHQQRRDERASSERDVTGLEPSSSAAQAETMATVDGGDGGDG
eukprot:CAMPEP_0119467424 /NCGR_PEP_ID=MMETSP1344-20130328/1617_1 /TAXON_ID=236787 /ORGANISM="Florenciella parvula, Strain CCMP2471" /LENGTH=294 /DNA_ID=CAMNT_0007499789 /DNA_START=74 /DNA_END=955 /DNA_ORIENTATION=-